VAEVSLSSSLLAGLNDGKVGLALDSVLVWMRRKMFGCGKFGQHEVNHTFISNLVKKVLTVRNYPITELMKV